MLLSNVFSESQRIFVEVVMIYIEFIFFSGLFIHCSDSHTHFVSRSEFRALFFFFGPILSVKIPVSFLKRVINKEHNLLEIVKVPCKIHFEFLKKM